MISGSAYCALVALMAVSNTPVKLCMYSVLAGLARSALQDSKRDQHVISPSKINTLSNRQVMRFRHAVLSLSF